MSDNPKSENDRFDDGETVADHSAGADDELPKRGSLVALFLVPLAIVSAFAMVTVLFSWLAFADERPEDLVRELQRVDRQSWRKAVQLVQLLRESGNDEIRQDAALAHQLTLILEEEIATADMSDERVQLRGFLCRALGEFQVPEVLSPLILAAKTERDMHEIDVRRSAFEAISIWWPRQSESASTSDSELVQIAADATARPAGSSSLSESRDSLRATATFTLGVLGGGTAQSRLVELLQDSSRDVRFNAAAGLARHGRAEAESVLLEMLDPANSTTTGSEVSPREQSWLREIVLRNALQSVQNLVAKNPQIDTRVMASAVGKLVESSDDQNVVNLATSTLQALNASQ